MKWTTTSKSVLEGEIGIGAIFSILMPKYFELTSTELGITSQHEWIVGVRLTMVAYHLIKWGGLLCELCILPMLYSAVLLDPFPYDLSRIAAVALTAAVSCAFAYLSSSHFKPQSDRHRLPLKSVIRKPPFIIWMAVVLIIVLQLTTRTM